jgi:hypothetical protein
MISGQLTVGALAAAFVVLVDYFFHLAAPSVVTSAGTVLFTAIFAYAYPFLAALRARVIGPVA